jgi:hypothetical protein
MALRCAEKYAEKYAERLHTWRPSRPHQHWVFGGSPSPTTRPPRVRKVGGLRVVGLGACWLQVLVGAGREVWDLWDLWTQLSQMKRSGCGGGLRCLL